MGTIPVSYTYADGQVLSTDGHNQNIYDATDDVSGTGIMSEANGGLDSANLDASFKINPEHVQVEAVVIGRQENTNMRIDCFSDAFGKSGSQAIDPVTKLEMTVPDATVDYWVPVPGCALRFWQPYDATVAVWQWSMFFHPARMKMLRQYTDEDGAADNPYTTANVADNNCWYDMKDACGLGLAVMIDGVMVDHTRRQTQVESAVRDNNTSLTNYKGFASRAYGGRTAQWWDMHHMSAPTYSSDDGSVSAPGLAKGWHDIQLVVYMERFLRTSASQEYTPIRNGVPMTAWNDSGEESIRIKLLARCTFGIRNARVLTLL